MQQAPTARDIQRRIMADSYRRKCISCPNYTPKDWWECDVFELSKSNFYTEYEIKLSRADFKADRYKTERTWGFDDGYQMIERNKHQCLSNRIKTGPNRFYFVVPPGIVTLADIPEWAGYIEAEWLNGKRQFPVYIRTIKQAPRLHKEKLPETIRSHLLRTFYHRYQWWFLHVQNKEAA